MLTFEGKRYDLNTLPDEMKELVRGMQVADAQLRMHEDTLKVLAVGRQSMAMQLNENSRASRPCRNKADCSNSREFEQSAPGPFLKDQKLALASSA